MSSHWIEVREATASKSLIKSGQHCAAYLMPEDIELPMVQAIDCSINTYDAVITTIRFIGVEWSLSHREQGSGELTMVEKAR